MTKISKKLTNIMHVKSEDKLIRMFVTDVIDKGVDLRSVKCPSELEDISTSFVDRNWKVANLDLKNKLIYVKPKSGGAYFIFGDRKLEKYLINLATGLKLEVDYKYLERFWEKNLESKSKDLIERAVIVTKTIRDGIVRKEETRSEKFNPRKYSVARCI